MEESYRIDALENSLLRKLRRSLEVGAGWVIGCCHGMAEVVMSATARIINLMVGKQHRNRGSRQCGQWSKVHVEV